jgi:hypothetical protein
MLYCRRIDYVDRIRLANARHRRRVFVFGAHVAAHDVVVFCAITHIALYPEVAV